jgi:2-dehydropantoate 2-reductase
MKDSLNLAIVGPGAIGLFYGARLAQAGARVSLLLRNDYEAVSKNGVLVKSSGPELRLAPSQIVAADKPEKIGPVDLVLVTLKTTANARFGELIAPLLGPDTAILTLQNGLGSDELLANSFGAERILGGLSFIACNRVAPGTVECFHPGTITLGEFGRPASERARAVAAWFEKAGVKIRVVDNLPEARWQKLIWNIPFNGLSIAAGGLPTDRVLADSHLAAEVRALMDEVAAAARAQGYAISEEFIQGQLDLTPKLGSYKPSSLLDWQAGKVVEVESIWGEPLRRARKADAAVPRLTLLYSLLQQLCRREG